MAGWSHRESPCKSRLCDTSLTLALMAPSWTSTMGGPSVMRTGIVSAERALLVAARAITPQAVDSLAVEVWSWWDCAQDVQMTILSTSSRLIWSVRRS